MAIKEEDIDISETLLVRWRTPMSKSEKFEIRVGEDGSRHRNAAFLDAAQCSKLIDLLQRHVTAQTSEVRTMPEGESVLAAARGCPLRERREAIPWTLQEAAAAVRAVLGDERERATGSRFLALSVEALESGTFVGDGLEECTRAYASALMAAEAKRDGWDIARPPRCTGGAVTDPVTRLSDAMHDMLVCVDHDSRRGPVSTHLHVLHRGTLGALCRRKLLRTHDHVVQVTPAGAAYLSAWRKEAL